MKRHLLILTVLAVTAAACGSDSIGQTDTTTSSTSTTTTTTPTTTTTTTAPDGREAQRRALDEARAGWAAGGLSDYDYVFNRVCFCLVEYVGPYQVSVRNGGVVSATLNGVDVLDIDVLQLTGYDQLILTVEDLFAEIERALSEAARVEVAYDERGVPTSVAIDWMLEVADDEITYLVEDLAAPAEGCSTSAYLADLVPQEGLPDPVAATRRAIYEAAMSCDMEALVALATTGTEPFTVSFGGGDPATYWTEQETQDGEALLNMVRHLNMSHHRDGDIYVWPAAFRTLTSPEGDGLSPKDYQELLTIYSVAELEEMFAAIGSYTGYRLGIAADGEWLFYVAGD